MTAWTPKAGETFLIHTGPGDKKHLFVILNDPMPMTKLGYGNVLTLAMVSLSTNHGGVAVDNACLLDSNCGHPFVTESSFVCYRLARIERAEDIAARVNSNEYPLQSPMPTDVLMRIIDGIQVSEAVRQFFIDIADEYL